MADPVKKDDNNKIVQYAGSVGLTLHEDFRHFDINFFKAFAYLPDMAMHFGSFIAKKDFTRETTDSVITDSIGFFFYNIFEDANHSSGGGRSIQARDVPFVLVFPFTIKQKLPFKKNALVTYVSISVSNEYLKSFLKEEAEHFQHLFDSTNQFLMEELMTDDILRTVKDIVRAEEPGTMKSYYYKVKALELLFYLFDSLRKRERPVHQKLSDFEIKAAYLVRDKIISSLDKSSPIAELKQIAGMNELKLRKIFTQIFGMGIYEYYQHLRMKEAARLLKEENLSVSEAGYQMGFENLGHFTRVFEKHIGKKPKKYRDEVC